MRYHFKIHAELKGGYSAHCIEIPGCLTQGDSLSELRENMQESLNLAVSEPEDSKYLASLPAKIKSSKDIETVALDPQIALAFSVRYHRLKNGFSQKDAAKKMGFADIFSYQRLESPRCNPTLKTLSKLCELFPGFSLDQAIG